MADLGDLEEEDMREIGCFSKEQRARLLAWQQQAGSGKTTGEREL